MSKTSLLSDLFAVYYYYIIGLCVSTPVLCSFWVKVFKEMKGFIDICFVRLKLSIKRIVKQRDRQIKRKKEM